jgi:hypothetical protein
LTTWRRPYCCTAGQGRRASASNYRCSARWRETH